MRPLLIALLLLLPGTLCLPGPLNAAEVVPWLYEVAVPVEDQSEAERNRASSEGLLKLLTRLTGLTYLPRTPEVVEALDQADGYYNEFRFARVEKQEPVDPMLVGAPVTTNSLELVIQFDPVLAGIPVCNLIPRAQRRRPGLPNPVIGGRLQTIISHAPLENDNVVGSAEQRTHTGELDRNNAILVRNAARPRRAR